MLIGENYTSIATNGFQPLFNKGSQHSLALEMNGTLWSWGSNELGGLGDGTYDDMNIPVQIGSEFTLITTGARNSLALKVDGTLWTWGENYGWKIGSGVIVRQIVPVKIGPN